MAYDSTIYKANLFSVVFSKHIIFCKVHFFSYKVFRLKSNIYMDPIAENFILKVLFSN